MTETPRKKRGRPPQAGRKTATRKRGSTATAGGMPEDPAQEGGSADAGASAVTLIRKYGNRRLYDTRRSRYVTLEGLTELLARGEEIQVVDATTGEDVTKRVLTQMILQEEEERDQNILPVGFLKKLLQHRDDGLRDYVQKYLTASFDTWLNTQKAVGSGLQGLAGAAMDPRMLTSLFPWMAGMMPPGGPGQAAGPAGTGTAPPAAPVPPAAPSSQAAGAAQGGTPGPARPVADELQDLRARLAELERHYQKPRE